MPDTSATLCYIGLGSNLSNPLQQLRSAYQRLKGLSVSPLITSPIYRTKPLGPQDQADFLNAVIAMETELGAQDLLRALQNIEQLQHRVREIHWGPRTIDLDLLLYGKHQIQDSNLTVPHPEIAHREFVLYPLRDVAPALLFPNGDSLEHLIQVFEKSHPNIAMNPLDSPWEE